MFRGLVANKPVAYKKECTSHKQYSSGFLFFRNAKKTYIDHGYIIYLHGFSFSRNCSIVSYSSTYALRKKCPYSELFWSAFSRVFLLRISPYSVRMRGNAEQNNSECGHFLRSDACSRMASITS